MDLPEMFQLYEAASHQVTLLESCSDLYKSDWKLQGNTNTQLKLLCRASYTERSLVELQQRSECVQEQEFNYIVFKITVAEGIKKMYETYRDQQWTKLQEESTNMLQEILDIEHEPNQPPEDILTPPGSPPISPLRPTTEDLSFLNIPAPLSPIRDLTPPASPESSWTSSNTERHHYSRNLLSVFNEYSRDL